jgi:ribosomal protein S18 acetylase RimI-like enzyme
MNIIIRRADQNDATFISLLGRITFREAFGSIWKPQTLLNYLQATFNVDKIASSISKINNQFWVALADDLPVGFIKIKINSQNEAVDDKNAAQLQKIYVLNDFTGRQIGQQLQDVAISYLQQQGKKTLWLVVWDGNKKAINFYNKHQYTTTGKYHYAFEDDSFDFDVMVKKINS